MRRAVLLAASLLAFESFGFGFLLDAAKLAIGVSVMAVRNIRNCGRTPSENAPQIVSVTPADGAKDVDPNLGEIIVCFDRSMREGWSLTGNGWPKCIGEPEFDASMKKLTIKVQLEPEKEYKLSFNSGRYHGFLGQDGIPLTPCAYTFRTK